MKAGQGGVNSFTAMDSAATLTLPDNSNLIVLSGNATVTSLLVNVLQPWREVTFVSALSTTVFTNTNDPTVAGTIDLGGSNFSLGVEDVLKLMLRPDGTWVRSGGNLN